MTRPIVEPRDRPTRAVFRLFGLLALLLLLAFASPARAQTPPPQPSWGPGGYDYAHAGLTINAYGLGAEQYWIVEPAEPTPETAPVVAFYHGWGGIWPGAYGAFLMHLARKGFIVICPRYQESKWALPQVSRDHALAAVRDALDELGSGGHVTPDLTRFGVCGHSFGGVLSVTTGVLYEAFGLPRPRAIVAMEPGALPRCWPGGSYVWGDLSRLDPDTLLVVMVGTEDAVVCDVQGKEIFYEATDVTYKDYVVVRSDDHGDPPLVADHFAVGTYAELDALDTYGFWKVTTAAMKCAFGGEGCLYAFGGGEEQVYMGTWSDGTPVAPMVRLTTP